eukprot:sb/3460694/
MSTVCPILLMAAVFHISSGLSTFSESLSWYQLHSDATFYDRSTFYGFWSSYYSYGTSAWNFYSFQCPSGCDCSDSELLCETLSTSVSDLKFRDQSFQRMRKKSFPADSYPNFKTLEIISCSEMYEIEYGVLDKFPNLEELVIVKTALRELPKVEVKQPGLVNIALYQNSISLLSEDQFSNMANLKTLNLAENKINYVSGSAFTGTKLEFLSLAYNQLSKVPHCFQPISSTLQYMGLEGNKIDTLPIAPLSSMGTLYHGNFSNNPIDRIEMGVFPNCTSLAYLELHNTSISSIRSYSFTNMTNLKYISLFRNSNLTAVEGNAFVKLPQLHAVLFQHSSLMRIDYRAFDNTPSLEYLIFDHNQLTAYPHALFFHSSLQELSKLSFRGNKISDLAVITAEYYLPGTEILTYRLDAPFNTSLLPNLHTLDLGENSIAEVPVEFFRSMPSLNTVYLDHNIIKQGGLPEGVFEAVSGLVAISMSHDQLSKMPTSIKSLVNLNTLYVDGNLLTFLEEGTFQGTVSLSHLDLSDNNIISIEDGTFPISLTYLDLSGNSFRFLDVNQFSNLAKLSTLYLSHNKIESVPVGAFQNCSSLTNVDLSYNALLIIQRKLFEVTPLSGTINLSYNQIHTIEAGTFGDKDFTKFYAQSNHLYHIPDDGIFSNLTQSHVAIDLSNNRLGTVGSRAFYNITSLLSLDLADNLISSLQSYAISQINTVYGASITLSNNPLRKLGEGSLSFITYTNYLYIYLKDLEISEIPYRSFENVTATSVYFSDNKITKLGREALYNVDIRSSLYLDNVGLQYISTRAIVGSVYYLRLNSNGLTRLPEFSLSSASCTYLYINSNGLKVIERNSLTSVRYLILNSNAITRLNKDTFQAGLVSLEVASNSITLLEKGVFDTVETTLTTVNLMNNNLRVISEDILPGSLRTLYLTGNNGLLTIEDNTAPLTITTLPAVQYFSPTLATSITGPISLPSSIQCSCSNFNSIATLQSKGLLSAPSPLCVFGDVSYSATPAGSNYYQTAQDLLCEPVISNYNRKTLTFTDEDLPETEKVWIKWGLPDPAIWGSNDSSWCGCVSNCPSEYTVTCINESGEVIESKTEAVDSSTCGKKQSQTFTISYRSGTVACRVKLTTTSGQESFWTPYTVLYPEDISSVAEKCKNRDRTLTATYFDFSSVTPGFENPGECQPAIRVTKLGDRRLRVLQEDLCLGKESKRYYTWFARNWYPLDDITTDLNRDEDQVPHNLYFTTHLYGSVELSGEVTIGGPDDIWVYISGVLVMQILAPSDDSLPLPCGEVKLKETYVTVTSGVLDSGACVLNGSVETQTASFEANQPHSLDIFLTQRRSLSSTLYIALRYLDESDTVASRFQFKMSENTPPDGIIGTLTLPTSLNLTVNLPESTAEKFQIRCSTGYTNLSDIAEPGSNVFPTSPGVPSYFNCSTSPSFPPSLTPISTSTTLTNTTTLLLVLATRLDYESDPWNYTISITVTLSEQFSVTLGVLVVLEDVNDNCPSISPSLTYSTPYPLSVAAFTLPVTDPDSPTLQFYLGRVERPADEDQYNTTLDYFENEDIMMNYTVEIYILDWAGKGALTTINISLSTSCIRGLSFTVDPLLGVFRPLLPGWMSSEDGVYCEPCTAGYRCTGEGARTQCTTCDMVYIDGTPAGTEPGCSNPSGVEYSFGGQAVCEPCKLGWTCSGGLATPVLEEGRYVKPCTDTECDKTVYDCQPGHACVAGVSEECQPGSRLLPS